MGGRPRRAWAPFRRASQSVNKTARNCNYEGGATSGMLDHRRSSRRGANPFPTLPPAGSPSPLQLHQGGPSLAYGRAHLLAAPGVQRCHIARLSSQRHTRERKKAMEDRLRLALLVMTACALASCATAPQSQSVNARAVCEKMTRDSASSPDLVSPDFFKQCMIARGFGSDANPTKD
jgi:hypothetical protein